MIFVYKLIFLYGSPVVVRCMGSVGSWVYKFTRQWVGLDWICMSVGWVGLGWVGYENGPTDNSTSARYSR